MVAARQRVAQQAVFCAVLVVLAAAATVSAQETPASIRVSAERSWVLAGRTLAVEALVLGEFGETVGDAAVQWASSNPAVASVSGAGLVTGRLPGRAVVEATSGGVSAQLVIWVQPARIEIAPERIELEIGGRLALTARALDADLRPLAGSSFTWYGTLPGVASIDSSGNLEGIAGGTLTITARLNVPGGGAAYTGQSRVTVRPRALYRTERIVSSDLPSPSLALKAIQSLSYSNDRFAFIGALSNGGQALVLYENGTFRKVIAAGEPLGPGGNLVANFGGVSINARGDILAQIGSYNSPGYIALFPYGKPLSQTEFEQQPPRCCYCCTQISNGSLADNGDFVYGIQNGPGDELYYRAVGRAAVQIPTDNLPGVGRGQWMRNSVRLAGAGQAVFQASGPNGWAYFLWDGRQVRRLLGLGDTVLGKRVDWAQQPVVAGPGDIYLAFGGPNYNRIGRWSAGGWVNVVEGGQQFGGVQFHHVNGMGDAQGNSFLFDGNTDQGPGIYRYAAGALQRLMALDGPESGRFQFVRNMFLRPDGDAMIHGPWGNAHGRLARVSGSGPVTLFETGRAAGFTTPLFLNWQSLGGVGVGESLLTRSVSGALMRVERDAARVVLSPGDLLADGSLVDWVGASATTANGDTVLDVGTTRGSRIYLYRQGSFTEALGPNSRARPPSGNFEWSMGRLGINTRGEMAAFVRAGNPGPSREQLLLFSLSSPVARIVMMPGDAAPGGGGTFGWVDEVIVDELGRVWFTAHVFAGPVAPGVQGLYVWENGQLRRAAWTGDRLPDGRRLSQGGFGRLMTAGGKIYLTVRIENDFQAPLVEADGSRLRLLIGNGDTTSFGAQISGLHYGGQFRVAPNGDIAYLAHLSGQPSALLVRKPDGRDLIVARHTQRIGNGPWIDSLLDVAWTEQSRLLFSASTLAATDRIDLYLATPQ